MAQVRFIRAGEKRTKKWMHSKVLLKRFVFRISILSNIVVLGKYLHDNGYLTNIYEKVAPILESLITQLPL